jgi:hypothetical protein
MQVNLPQIMASVAVVSQPQARHRSRDRDRQAPARRRCLREAVAGRKIGDFKK